MSRRHKVSTNDHKHPYLRGYGFWKNNQFWNTDFYSEKSKEYFNKSLAVMQAKDRVLARIDNTIL